MSIYMVLSISYVVNSGYIKQRVKTLPGLFGAFGCLLSALCSVQTLQKLRKKTVSSMTDQK